MEGGQPAPSESTSTSAAESPLKVNLQIVSPSFGVGNLPFPDMPAVTTVLQLKEKIRDALPSLRPTNEQQRLIHRGRMLARDNDTLQDVFGPEALQTGDLQSLHLVVRDVDQQDRASSNPSSAPGNAATQPNMSSHPRAPQPHQNHQPQHPHHHHHHPPMHANPAFHFGATPPQQVPQILQQQLQHIHQQQLQQQLQQQHQTMLQWSNQLQREAGYRQLIHQQQRERAMMGYNGVQGNQGNPVPPTGPGNVGGGRNSPAPALQQPGQTVTREVLGPNGQYYRITESFNTAIAGAQPGAAPTSNAQPQGRASLSPADVQNIIRGADATQATQAMTNAMHRSASGASLVNMAGLNANAPIQPIQPGVTRPISPLSSPHASRTATPDPQTRSSSSLGGLPAHTFTSQPTSAALPQLQLQSSSTGVQPEVYILYSPSGPRGLLINNPSEMYITPARQPQVPPFPSHLHHARPPMPPQLNVWQPHGPFDLPQLQFPQLPPVQLPPLQTPQQAPQVPQLAAQVAQPQQAQVQAQAQNQQGRAVPVGQADAVFHPNNPPAGAWAALIPHLWLVIRLTAFVWWFTSGDPSWSRWLSMVAIAVAVFVINTGILNGAAHQVWDPFRRHVEGLLPLQNHQRQQNDLRGNGQGQVPGVNIDPAQQPREPDPAHVAARLLAERRNANGNWVMDQIRRVERAGLLFLASIAPGVAERHIANLEQQEREERRRREADEAAAAAAAATAALETARARLEEQRQGARDTSGGGQSSGNEDQSREGHENPGERAPEEPPPLIQI